MKFVKNMKSPILITITIAIVIAKVYFFRYELFNDLSLIGLLSESILWILPYFFNSPIGQKKKNPIMIVISLIITILMILVTWYERSFLIVPSYFDLSQSGQAASIVEMLPYLYTFSDVIYFMDTLILIVVLVVFRKSETLSVKRVNIVMVSLLLLVSIIIQSIESKTPLTIFLLHQKIRIFEYTNYPNDEPKQKPKYHGN